MAAREFKKVGARIEIETTEAGSEALIDMLEEVLEMAKRNPEMLAAGEGEHREAVFERISASEFIGAAHRS
jgi:hypothetical protein